jgi:hypothetical protein
MSKLVCEEYFGGCPQCGEAYWANIRKSHWCYCPNHKVRWWVGENIFSSWRDETETDWCRNHEMLDNFKEVEPLDQGETIPMAEEAAQAVSDLFRRIGAA